MSDPRQPSSVGKFFDQKAKSWDQGEQRQARSRVIADAMRSMLPPLRGQRALEYGAGTGLLSMELLGELGELVALDVSEGMLEAFRQKTLGRPSVRVLAHDLSREDLDEAPFDLIYSAMTLHHVQDVEALLGRFRRMLLPGGHLAIADLEREDGSFHEDPKSYFHAGFEPAQLARLLERAGFRDVRHMRVYTMTKSVRGVVKPFPLFLIVAAAEGVAGAPGASMAPAAD